MVFDLESWNIVTVLVEVLILIASYHGMKMLLRQAPAALHAQKYDRIRSKRDDATYRLRNRVANGIGDISTKPSSKTSSPKSKMSSNMKMLQNKMFQRKLVNATLPMELPRQSRLHLPCPDRDDDVSIDFGEDAEDFNEREIIRAQQRAIQNDLPVQMDRLPEQIRAAYFQRWKADVFPKNKSSAKFANHLLSLTNVPSTDSLAIEQYRMARKISPVNEDDCHFWQQSNSQAPADPLPSPNSFHVKATKVESPLSCAQPPPEPATAFPAPVIEYEYILMKSIVKQKLACTEIDDVTFVDPHNQVGLSVLAGRAI
jgi:hypothetical protein